MRILQINKFFHLRGGADTFFFKTCDLLSTHGHEVAHFSTRHEKNNPSPYSRYFVDGFTEQDVPKLSWAQKAGGFVHGIYSRPAYRALQALVRDFQPDVAHVHNLNYQLSPSIFDALHDAGVPAVMTLHDYTIVCGAGTLFVHDQNCERCRGGRHYHALLQRCFHDSIPASAMVMLSHYRNPLRGAWSRVNRFISPSKFMRDKLADFGMPRERISHLPNFIDFAATPQAGRHPGEYILYFGRFSRNKGIDTLLRATESIQTPLMMVGDGPELPEIQRCAARRGGRLIVKPFTTSREELKQIIANSRFVVVPSIWYENQPTTVLESYALGKTVVASDSGGIPELVDEGTTGTLFRASDTSDLKAKIEFGAAHPELCQKWGEAGSHKLTHGFSREAHYKGLMDIYGSVMLRKAQAATPELAAAGGVR